MSKKKKEEVAPEQVSFPQTHSGLMAKHYMDEFNKEEARLRGMESLPTDSPSAKRAGTEPSLNKYLKLYLQYADK